MLVSGAQHDHWLRPGLAAAVSMAAGFRLEQPQPARALVLTVPSRLRDGTPPREPEVWELDRGSGAVFGATLREVAIQCGQLDAWTFVRACESVVALVSGRDGLGDDLLAQARVIVRRHANDVDFDPTALADRLGWSLRSVQQSLRRAGTTPAELIRSQRLELAITRLQQPAWRAHTVSHVAHASAFGSLSAFNSAFRARFGCTPVEVRTTGAGS